MTIANTDALAGPFIPNGVTTVFPFSFKAFSKAELRVFYIDTNGVEVDISAAAYNATINPTGGGSVVFVVAPLAALGTLYIESNPAFTQNINFENQSAFRAPVHTEGLDRSAAKDIWLRRRISRAFSIPLSGNFDGKFPVVLPGGVAGFASGTGNDPALRADLASDSGGNLVGVKGGNANEVKVPVATLLMTYVDVRRFGAACDGAADDTLAVQRALDVAATSLYPVEVVIPGRCKITSTLYIDRAVDATKGLFNIRGSGPGAGFYVTAAITLFSSRLPYGSFGMQKAPPSEYIVFRDLLIEHSNAAAAAYVVSDKFLRYRVQNCEIRRFKWLAAADYVQTVYFVGCHIRGWQGTFFASTDGYDVLIDGGCMFEAGATGFVFSGAVNRLAWIGGIYEGCSGSSLSIAGVNGLAMMGIYYEGNSGQEVVLGTAGGVSRGVAIIGCKYNLPGGRLSPYPVDLGRAYGVAIDGCYSNSKIADNTLVYPFQLTRGHNYGVAGDYALDPEVDRTAVATAAPNNTQATAAVIVKKTNIFTTVAAVGNARTMPPVAMYRGADPITIINVTGNGMNVYPAAGERFLGSGTNAAIAIASGARVQIYPSDSDYWVTA